MTQQQRYSSINITPTDNGHMVQTHYEPPDPPMETSAPTVGMGMKDHEPEKMHFPTHEAAAEHASKIMKAHEAAGGAKGRKGHPAMNLPKRSSY